MDRAKTLFSPFVIQSTNHIFRNIHFSSKFNLKINFNKHRISFAFDFVCIYLFIATCPLRHLLASMHSTKTIWPISSAERSSTLQQVCPKSSNLISNSINSAKDSSARKEIVIVKKKNWLPFLLHVLLLLFTSFLFLF